jgi:predicted HTH domain antitoxin
MAVEALVLAAVGQRMLSTGHAAELLGLGYFETLALIKKRGVPNLTTEEDLAVDHADLKEMFPDSFAR